MAMDPTKQDLLAIVEDLGATAKQFASARAGDDAATDQLQRRKILDAAYKVISTVKTQDDEWMEGGLPLALQGAARLFYEWKVFDLIPKEGWVSYGEVAGAAEVEEALLSKMHFCSVRNFELRGNSGLILWTERVAGVLVSLGVLAHDGQGKIGHTHRSLAWRREEMSSCALDLL